MSICTIGESAHQKRIPNEDQKVAWDTLAKRPHPIVLATDGPLHKEILRRCRVEQRDENQHGIHGGRDGGEDKEEEDGRPDTPANPAPTCTPPDDAIEGTALIGPTPPIPKPPPITAIPPIPAVLLL